MTLGGISTWPEATLLEAARSRARSKGGSRRLQAAASGTGAAASPDVAADPERDGLPETAVEPDAGDRRLVVSAQNE